MHGVVASGHLEAALVVYLLYLIRLNVHVVGSPELAVVLGVVLIQLLLLLPSIMSVINLPLTLVFGLILGRLLGILKVVKVDV